MNIKIHDIINIAVKAGDAIMEIYKKDFSVVYKNDNSPLTEADKKSNDIICSRLKETYPEIPIISEENKEVPYDTRKSWEYYWLIDPLDGTKEFIKKNGEFSVNIALIKKNRPIISVIYAPALNLLYYAEEGNGAFKIDDKGQKYKLPLYDNKSENLIKVVSSKSHSNVETERFIDNLRNHYKNVELLSKGSSLKICLVAEGIADIYPRLGQTMEWDIAAGDIIASEAGKKLYKYEDGKIEDRFTYNKENLVNSWFVVKDKDLTIYY
ncbi:MAG: 3'(2'),5'-bisphosphate nucleotidase [Candidatus Acididesulfobacter diazotrophicus]|uniref:3'(2'),5'-bisphosphate nucleotidase CysQ n=1 Tax=Candidatus Acididesulfobacter diazotrophicus TaxID=2597226 RepID=A0A519BKF6_9DELT|nr:MAG: 3'(2'),5'-bisphosphate nucleotidase [Candidatus Acididesulfobacter diazotrophicus]